jgi:MFS family permease
VFLAAMLAGRLAGDRLRVRLGPVRLFRVGALVAGAGFGGCLLVDTPAAGIIGLALLGGGVAVLLPLAISAAGNLDGETAAAVARVSTLGYLGSFVGPALVGALAAALSLAAALGLPALLGAGSALGARAVAPAAQRRTAAPSTS